MKRLLNRLWRPRKLKSHGSQRVQIREPASLKSKNKSSSSLSSLIGVQKHFQGLTQDERRYRFVPPAGQGSLTNSPNAVRNFWLEGAIIGANERVRPHAETEDSS